MRALSVVPLIMATGFAAVAAVVLAQDQSGAQAVEPLALRKIMKDLGIHMQAMTDGISREDWAVVEKRAVSIVDHPQPPVAERAQIIGFFGSQMAKFKGLDDEIKTRAQKLSEAAAAKDGQAVIAAFQSLQTSCYDCHREFRNRFLDQFYGRR